MGKDYSKDKGLAGIVLYTSEYAPAAKFYEKDGFKLSNGTICMYCEYIYSEKKDGYLQNIGYLGEQLDLYLVSRNIGTLWFGIGKTKEEPFEDMEFVIMFSIRKISDDSKYRKDMFKSKRKNTEEIWEGEQISGVTDIIRFAPSACNSQPWLVKNDGKLWVYRYKKPGKRGIMPADKVLFYNRIDIGIFICFMDLCLEHNGIGFEKTLYSDADDVELVLNAKYRLCRGLRFSDIESLIKGSLKMT